MSARLNGTSTFTYADDAKTQIILRTSEGETRLFASLRELDGAIRRLRIFETHRKAAWHEIAGLKR